MFHNKNLSFMYLGLRLSSNLRVIIFTYWNPPMCIRESRLRNLPIKLKRRDRLRCRWNNKLEFLEQRFKVISYIARIGERIT